MQPCRRIILLIVVMVLIMVVVMMKVEVGARGRSGSRSAAIIFLAGILHEISPQATRTYEHVHRHFELTKQLFDW